MPSAGGLGVIKQDNFFSNTAISSRLGKLIRVSFSLISPPRVAAGVLSSTGQASLLTEELATNSCLNLTVLENDTCVVGESGTGFSRKASRRIFLADRGAAKSASDRRL